MTLVFMALVLITFACTPPPAPEAVLPIPNEHQIAWQEMEFYGFIHFSINTFTNKEWGYGDTPAEMFNPTEMDVRQWVRVAKEAGMTGIILTCKHHSGFCLWPSEYTEYSIKNSPWKDGQGDIMREFADACKEYGLKMGVYLSPWDRNYADYGKPEYITYFRNQLKELLTNYGDVFEVWFDGANGGDGYYGGADETRWVDKKSYYDWENTIKMIREISPSTIIWSDAGPDARWIGNEHGYAYPTTWSLLLRDEVYGGMPEYAKKYSMGQENGTHWVPGEADVSIRPGWFYHKSEDNQVKTLEHLMDIYYRSVGQNSTLLLNLPVDTRGLVHEKDIEQLQKFAAQVKLDFEHNLAEKKPANATNTRGGSSKYGATNTNDGDKHTYWATDDDVIQASLTIDLEGPTRINRFLVQEYIQLGQRIKAFSVEAEIDGEWKTIDEQTTIGYKRILRFDPVVASKVRLNIIDAKACPVISNIEVYNAPLLLDVPMISRNKEGEVSFKVADGVDVFYTTNGNDPDLNSAKYSESFVANGPTIVKAFSYDPVAKRKSSIAEKSFDISKKEWVIKSKDENAVNAIDDSFKTNYAIEKSKNGKVELLVDLGEPLDLKGFAYTPQQAKSGRVSGIVTHYTCMVSNDEKNWVLASKGEFSNIVNNPIRAEISFGKIVNARFVKFVGENVADKNKAIIAEFDVITK